MSVTALLEVLAGRDEPPAWRSAVGRRVAQLAAWLGWGLLAVSAVAAVTIGLRQHGWQGGPGAAGLRGAGVPHGSGILAWLGIGLAVSAAVPLLPRYPLLGWRIAWLAVLVTPLVPGQNRVNTEYYLVLTAAFVVAGLRYGVMGRGRTSARTATATLAWLAILTLVPAWLWTPQPALGPLFSEAPGQAMDWTYPVRLTIGLAVLTAGLYGAGRWRRDRLALAATRQEARQQREFSAVIEKRSADLERHSAVLAERARIAREMHDVVAHHMSMIAVQAETAPYRVSGLPETARGEFAALSELAREALADMRRLLGVLRSDGAPDNDSALDNSSAPDNDSAPDRAPDLERMPQPGLADVPGLVDAARRAGVEVSLDMPEPVAGVPGVVGLAAYRIVQESLSNARRHAPGAEIRVSVGQENTCVLLDVVNGISGASGTPQPEEGEAGHGLAGMRERVALLGGQLRAGPADDGGYAVHARLPVSGAGGATGSGEEAVR